MSKFGSKWSITRRLIGYTVVFSSSITLLITAFQLFDKYLDGVHLVRGQITQIEKFSLSGLTENLWNLYEKQIQIQLDDLVQLPDLRYLEIRSKGEVVAVSGTHVTESTISEVLPMIYHREDEVIRIGEILVVATLEGVYKDIFDQMFVILGSNAVKTSLVSIFMFFAFQHLVTRHLLSISNHLQDFSPGHFGKKLVLKRRAVEDEFDQVVTTINDMGARIEADEIESVKAEKQLRQAQKMEAIGQLTGGIAHDFNNLLMVIDGYARRATAKLDDTEAAGKAIEEVLKGTDRAAKLTKQLLRFSRRQVLERRVFQIEEVFSDVQELLHRSTGERHTLRFAPFDGGACVDTDPSELGQALVNLAINARDASPQGGDIAIGADVVDLDQGLAVAGGDLAPGRYVVVSVQDHGEGIDEETLQHIFEPFFTTKEQGKGTGLGLAMVYGFAKQSGGAVQVESAVGKGTTFGIYLPLVERKPQPAVVEMEQEHRGNGETILVVEDDEALLALTRDMLKGLGYNVLAASNGLEALEIDGNYDSEIDLLLSDVVMPIIGGFEVGEMLRIARPDIKIVFMSGYPDRGDSRFEKMPASAQFLQKPVRQDRLAKVIRAELDHIDQRLSA